MQFDVVDIMKYPGARSVELRRTDFDVERGAIASSVESFTAPPGSALPMRMDPVVGDRATVTFSALTVVQADGSRIDVPGPWQLNLSLPENIDSLRRVERLSTPFLSESGVPVAVEGAVRSVNETVVTVRFDAAEDVRQVGQPWIEGDGRQTALWRAGSAFWSRRNIRSHSQTGEVSCGFTLARLWEPAKP